MASAWQEPADEIYREKLERARHMTPAERFLAGPLLAEFRACCQIEPQASFETMTVMTPLDG